MIVSDAGPIIIFARVRRLPLLHEVTGSLIIPAAVHDEILGKKGSMPGAAEVASAAIQLGIDVIGTLRVLAEAKRLGQITVVRPIIAEMQSNGYRFDRALIRRFLERISEG